MPRPLVGVGHSYGSNVLVNLSLIHPRLLSTLVLMDPVIQPKAPAPQGPSPTQASTFRRDLWPSRAEAEISMRKSPFYKSWDPRVLDRWLEYGIRETPTALYPNEKGAATLTTTKHQECFIFLRPSWEAVSEEGHIEKRDLVPDMDPASFDRFPFYRPEPPNTLRRLPEVRPSVLYIFGGDSPMSTPEARQLKMELTGTGVGGSGGAKLGMVKEVVLEGVGHLVAMEDSEQCADAGAAWLGRQLKHYEAEQRTYLEWAKRSLAEKQTMSKEWEKRIGGPIVRPSKPKL
ncbi:hypothetical protein BP6252_09816 [Coleophoma cylindrospora]|uniref:AB hydrolase-1 domain-containing protein n=1 Tax=Coleophoma cylindrospora TaxID=1849047 RepID=A0A3D8QWW0_9HELO|nr:hypothetical protein BP6252_09816 [Coleophoma cylindrospora]